MHLQNEYQDSSLQQWQKSPVRGHVDESQCQDLQAAAVVYLYVICKM